MRTELRFGDVAEELARRLAESPDQILILGISQPCGLGARFGALLRPGARSPVLIVYRGKDSRT
jgi:hypothetical protein